MTQRLTTAILIIFAFLLGSASAQPAPIRAHFPVTRNGQAPPIVTLDGGDNTFLSAVVAPGGCTFLSYIDRDDDNRLHVVRDAGLSLVEVELPTQTRAAPAFVAPGEKQADGELVIKGGQLVLYYTSRDEDDPSGSFKLKRLTMPLPGCG